MYKYNKEQIKENLTIKEVYRFVLDHGGDPIMKQNFFIARTICHNPAGEGSYKLYYYNNSKLFKCFTECDNSFDIFELVRKIKKCSLYEAILYIVAYFNLASLQEEENLFNQNYLQYDWQYFKRIQNINLYKTPIIEYNHYDNTILQHFPIPKIPGWEQEGISYKTLKYFNIRYDPINEGIIIPHYDLNNNLIGIRERTLVKEEEKYGKYRPAKINGILYNHALSFNLFNLNHSINNIKQIKKAIVFEGEKATMQYSSLFGQENDISVAVCGSTLTNYQVQLLLSLGVQEISIAFDRQYQKIGDKEFKQWTQKLTNLYQKYHNYIQISFIFDKENLLFYKNSPIDQGKEIFLNLYNQRFTL